MAFKVEFSKQSADDLDAILAYMSDVLCNPQAAERFFGSVYEKIGLIRDNPYMFQLCNNERLSTDGIRSVGIGNFLIFYLIDDSAKVVSISRILYGKRDIPAAFDKNEP